MNVLSIFKVYLDELLSLVFQRLPLPVHDGLQLLEVSQLDLKLFHLSLNQYSDKGFDLSLLDGPKVLSFHRCGAKGGASRTLERFYLE